VTTRNPLVMSTDAGVGETSIVGVVFPHGSSSEPEGRNGLAHLAEHMLLQSPRAEGGRSVAQELELLGAEYNAGTGRDYTFAYAIVVADVVDVALAALATVLERVDVDERALEFERRVVLQEIESSCRRASTAVALQFDRLVLRPAGLARPPLGAREDVAALTAEQVRRWIREVLPRPPSPQHEEARDGEKHVVRLPLADGAAPMMRCGFPGLPFGHPDHFVAQVACRLVAGDSDSWLTRHLVAPGKAAYALARHDYYRLGGVLYVDVGLRDSGIEQVLDLVEGGFEVIADGAPTRDEVRRVADALERRFAVAMSDPHKRAAAQLRASAYGYPDWLKRQPRYTQVDAAAVSGFAARLLDTGGLAAAAATRD
jgi:predicted Zn-dependent peptidase